jgi:large repetitive protein
MPFKSKFRALLTLVMIAGGLLMYSGATHAAVSPTYFYDELNRLIEVDYDDGTKINYVYDQIGNRTQTIVSLPLGISTTSLLGGDVGCAYNQNIIATGGTAPYNWSITSGSLPAGLSLNASSGAITGTPTSTGYSTFTVQVMDANNNTVTQSLGININAQLIISTTSLPSGYAGNTYYQNIAATGGVPTYSWSVTSGSLPAGLSLNSSTGAIAGTPSTAGTSNFTVQLQDGNNVTVSTNLSIVVNGPLIISTASLPAGYLGNAYNQTLTAAGGVAPYSWPVISLPAGLSLNSSTGAITGTPTSPGSYGFTAQVQDSNNATANKYLTIIIVSSTQLSIYTGSLPGGDVGAAYSQALVATGGATPYSWTVTSGSLPVGLTLNASSGTITGTPTSTGTSTFTIQVQDANNSKATSNLSIVVSAQPSISTSSLPGGDVSSSYSQTLAVTGGTAPYNWSVTSGSLPARLSLNSSTGAITGTPSTAGTSTFTAQVQDVNGATASKSLSIVVSSQLSVSTASLPGDDIGNAYSQTLVATGGVTPFIWSITRGSLPAGLTLNTSSGAITGTPTATGTSNFTVQVNDANNDTATQALTIIISSQLNVSTASLPSGYVGTSYSQTLTATGGATPYSWSVTSGSLPAGLSLNASTGAITGTPTAAGGSTFTVQVQDSNSFTATQSLSIIVYSLPSISTTSLSGGDVSSPYSQTLVATGGSTPYSWSITSGSLPSGLSLNASTGAITGTPSATGTKTFTVKVQDANTKTATQSLSIVISAQPSVSTTSLPGDDIGSAYNQTLAATGGSAPFNWSITSGSLPTGLSLNASSGTITGTPTATGTSSFTVKVQDAYNNTATKSLSIVISAQLSISTASLPSAYVGSAYSQTLAATGGATSYSWSITSGSLPANLSLNASTGAITGTSTTAGSSSFTIQVKDGNSVTATASLSIVVYTQPSVSTTSLSGGDIGSAYSQTLVATGGDTPYSWSVSSGSLPSGLSLNASTGAITGTPTATGTSNFTVKVADSNNVTATKSLSITISTALSISTSSLPSGTIGTSYSQTLAATGGATSYSWSIISGSLPASLSLNASTGAITGTPSTAGTSTFTVQLQDGNNVTVTKSLSIIVYSLPSISTTSLSGGDVSGSYSQTLVATGGETPYSWSITSGSLPSGLSLNASTGAITGTPTATGTKTFTVKVQDANTKTATQSLSIVVSSQLSVSTTSLPNDDVGSAYSQTLVATGGATPYSWSVTSGSLPAGLSLAASTGAITGTPTTAGSNTFTVQVQDANSVMMTKSLSIVISAQLSISTTTLPGVYVGSAYSQTLAATGGATSYSWSITSGSLPANLSLNASTGAITGTPSTAGTSTFTVQVKDGNSVTATASLSIVVYAQPSVSTTSLSGGDVSSAYSQTLAATGGVTPYSWSISSGSLPAGLSLTATTGAITGTPTATGTKTFTVKVADSNNATATKSLSITISTALSISTYSLPGGTSGFPYTAILSATGGNGSYTWSITSGSLPAGLSLNASSGYITGTPSTSGTSNFTVQVQDGNSDTVTKSFSITVS